MNLGHLNCLLKIKGHEFMKKKNHLHFDVKSVIDSFDFLWMEKNMDNGYQIEWRSIDTQNQENLVVQPWHEFCQTIVGSKIFIIIARKRPRESLFKKPPVFQATMKILLQSKRVHEVHIKIPGSLIYLEN